MTTFYATMSPSVSETFALPSHILKLMGLDKTDAKVEFDEKNKRLRDVKSQTRKYA